MAFAGFALAAVAILFYLQANHAREEALEQRENARKALTQFKVEQKKTIIERYNRLVEGSIPLINDNQFNEAISQLKQANAIIIDYANSMDSLGLVMEIDSGGVKAKNLIAEANRKIGDQNNFDQFLSEGEEYERNGERYYVLAQEKYRAARNLNYNNDLANSRLLQIKIKLDAAFIQFVKHGDIYFDAKGYDFALREYSDALKIHPRDNEVLEKIKRTKLRINQ